MGNSKRNRHPVFVEVPKADEFKLPIIFISYGKRDNFPVELVTNVPTGVEVVEVRFEKGKNRNIKFLMSGGANLFITIEKHIDKSEVAKQIMTFEGASNYKLFLV